MKLLLKISILTVLCIFAINTNAQIPAQIDGVSIQTNRTNPRPNQTVEVSVDSYNIDLNAASIVWMVNDKVQNQGVGLRRIDVLAPKIGKITKVTANIKSAQGGEISKTINISSGAVDIVWESDGYAPPFYKGKLPFAYENPVRLTAIPHLAKIDGKELDPKTLVYSWKLGGKYIENGQGYGKQSVLIDAGDIPKALEISVEVTNREQTLHTEGSIVLTPSEPSVSFYEEDSLYGILFNKALKDEITLKNSEMKIIAIPYGFNLKNMSNSYTWMINDLEQPDLIKNRSIIIRTKGDIDGSSNINLDIRNENNILQGARGGFTVYFKKKQ